MPTERVFLLSPARSDGERAKLVMNPDATFDLARRLRDPEGATIGETFAFLSGLYFRGKLAYAGAFARRRARRDAALVITTDRGLVSAGHLIHRQDLVAFGEVDLAGGDPRFVEPLRRDAERLAAELRGAGEVVLLGSVATGKYVDVLLAVFGERLLFPAEFVGRGDMSRGGLMLRAVRDGRELDYVPVAGSVRRGKRPPRLEPRR